MSYDIELRDPVTNKVIELPIKHMMTGGTYAAEYDGITGRFTPKLISEAWLNITYNYSEYYYDAAEGDERFKFALPEIGYEISENRGIRGIYGKSGAESIPMLKDLINRITEKYSKDGEWISTNRTETRYRNSETGEIIDFEEAIRKSIPYIEEEFSVEVNEGANDDYWMDTAGNAIKPLFQLIAMAQLRPDGIWYGD